MAGVRARTPPVPPPGGGAMSYMYSIAIQLLYEFWRWGLFIPKSSNERGSNLPPLPMKAAATSADSPITILPPSPPIPSPPAPTHPPPSLPPSPPIPSPPPPWTHYLQHSPLLTASPFSTTAEAFTPLSPSPPIPLPPPPTHPPPSFLPTLPLLPPNHVSTSSPPSPPLPSPPPPAHPSLRRGLATCRRRRSCTRLL